MRKNKLLITIAFFICLSFVLLSNRFLKEIDYQNYAANNYYTEKTLELYNDENLKEYLTLLLDDDEIDFSISVVDNKNKMRKIALFNDSIKPEIKEGRFISSHDFNDTSHNYAVVCETLGKNVHDTVEYEDTDYEVIGVYKKSGFSSDKIVFTNLKENDLNYSPTLKIDYNNNNNLFQSAKNNKKLNIKNEELVMFFESAPSKTIITIVTILFCLSILIVMYFFVEDKKDEIKLKYIFGYSFLKIYFDSLYEIMSCLFVAWIILAVMFFDLHSYIYFLFALVLIVISLLIPMFEILRNIKLVKKYENN